MLFNELISYTWSRVKIRHPFFSYVPLLLDSIQLAFEAANLLFLCGLMPAAGKASEPWSANSLRH